MRFLRDMAQILGLSVRPIRLHRTACILSGHLRVLIIQLERLGDLVQTTPLIQDARRRRAHGGRRMVVLRRLADVLRGACRNPPGEPFQHCRSLPRMCRCRAGWASGPPEPARSASQPVETEHNELRILAARSRGKILVGRNPGGDFEDWNFNSSLQARASGSGGFGAGRRTMRGRTAAAKMKSVMEIVREDGADGDAGTRRRERL